MGKIRINKIISMVILSVTCFLLLSFYGCQKDEYPFDLSEDAKIYSFDSNNQMKLSEIIVEQGRLIYKFGKRNRAGFTPEKISELKQETNCNFFMIENAFGFGVRTFDTDEIIEKGSNFYLILYCNMDSEEKSGLSGFKINQTEIGDSYYLNRFDNPYLSYISYSEGREYIQEYDKTTNKWSEIKEYNSIGTPANN